jgi:hypothetical protein
MIHDKNSTPKQYTLGFRPGVSFELLQAKPNHDVGHTLDCGKWRHILTSSIPVKAAFTLWYQAALLGQ